jgi:hypothetical protein
MVKDKNQHIEAHSRHISHYLPTMKTVVLALVLSLTASVSVSAFAPTVAFTRGIKGTSLFSEPPEEEEGGLDLDLSEMFEM